MFVDYKNCVLQHYHEKRDANLLPFNLVDPSPARVKDECIKVCAERYSNKDERMLRDFFGLGGNKVDCLRAISQTDIDKFKPLINFVEKRTNDTETKNIELLAWLIDFESRPFDVSNNYGKKQLHMSDVVGNTFNPIHFKIFLSYVWANADIADSIDNDFEKIGIHFLRDVRDATYRTSIKDFMHRVGKSDFVFMIISDEYLRSENCMYEVNELLNTHEFEKRILPVVTDNAIKIFKPVNRTEYYKFWKEKKEEADKGKVEFTNHDTIDYALKCQRIADNLPDFFRKITDLNIATFKKLKEDNYSEVLKIIGFK